MTRTKRVFILGAGFSKPVGMPLATELVPLLTQRLELDEMRDWLDGMRQRLEWLSRSDSQANSFKLNIEQVFHYAHFDIEVHRLRQHLAPVGRHDGPGTSWNAAESISAWLSYLERDLCDLIMEKQIHAELGPIQRWAKTIVPGDSVVTFNYDTLVERALSELGAVWNHGMAGTGDEIAVYKLHGSIDWIVAHRSEGFSRLDLLFDKENENRAHQNTGHVEDDCRLWRCRTPEQLQEWISGRALQLVSEDASPKTVGIAGLGAYKQLHEIPGLGQVWTRATRAVYEADLAVVIGFSMSDFDAMAQMQLAEVARARSAENRPLNVMVIDPFLDEASRDRFRRVFRTVDFIRGHHENIDWTCENCEGNPLQKVRLFERTQTLAYRLWKERGMPLWDDKRDWYEAEARIEPYPSAALDQ